MLKYAGSSSPANPNMHKLTQDNNCIIRSLNFRQYGKLFIRIIDLPIQFSRNFGSPNNKVRKGSSFQLMHTESVFLKDINISTETGLKYSKIYNCFYYSCGQQRIKNNGETDQPISLTVPRFPQHYVCFRFLVGQTDCGT